MIGIISFYLSRKEVRPGVRVAFLNFAILFLFNAFLRPIYLLLKDSLMWPSAHADFYCYLYSNLIYFLLLSISVVYLVMDQLTESLMHKYMVTLTIVAASWTVAFYPFLRDPYYVRNRPEVENVYLVRQATDELGKEGIATPTTALIASRVDLKVEDTIEQKRSLSSYEKIEAILSIIDYVPGDNAILLMYKPYWLRCAAFCLLNMVFLFIYFLGQYFTDSARGAYLEKIVWCLVPYCLFEVIHFYAYTRVKAMDAFSGIETIGMYASMFVMWAICGLMALRLHFLQTVEGGYYERRLLEKPEGITRWRDGLDKWVLRNFMNPGDLDRRFVIHRRTEE